ncbi:aspartate kinase [Anaeromyxobacter paludicola]|uniref:aspartate kinase n=1 Tax=Anaeromyxobacter paludicola TaxID=2918171 RepID=A0ABN6N3E0_9BACT|nr:aspartate kinase [Anaeromyxobacter paludicola]BDG07704.1 aspartate kinase [Anaeromyxobacter paludicola]
MISVEKIGGTSMSKFEDVLANIMLREPERIYGRVYVVSAYAGVTNQLLEHKKTGEPGVYARFASGADFAEALGALTKRLEDLNAGLAPLGLDLGRANGFIETRMRELEGYLDSMRHVLGSGYVRRENVLLAAREMLAAIGEVHSAFNSVEILKAKGVRARLLDLSGFDDDEPLTIDERIHESFQGVDPREEVLVVTGYTKGVEGIMREFDRGYSEVTFSKVAVELKADEAVIHKEYHLSSADPEIVGPANTVVVGATNYDVADQLADVGMEAIHPKAAKPMELAGIAIRLKNTFEPEHPGTLITKDYVGEKARIEVIAGTTKVSALEIHDPSMVGTVGFDLGVMEIFRRHGVSYIVKTTNANSITHVVWEKAVTSAFVEELENRYELVTVVPAAVVCVIGSNMAIPGVLARATQVLAENQINVNAFSQSLRQVNMQFVIDRADYKKAVTALNRALCLRPVAG